MPQILNLALHSMLDSKPPIVSSHFADESELAFPLVSPFLTSVSLLETERLFKVATTRSDSKIRASARL